MDRLRRVAVMIDLNEPVVHHQKLFAGIQRYAQESGRWECSVTPYAELLLKRNRADVSIDGVIGRVTPLLAKLARERGIPVVNVWMNSPTRGLPSVLYDGDEAGRMAAAHLLSRGFSSFGFVGYSKEIGSRLLLEGFRSTLKKNDHTSSECWVEMDYASSTKKWLNFQSVVDRWIDTYSLPVGIFVAHDLLCRYVAEACRTRKLRIPQDVALVGAFNETVVSAHASPSISSIDFGFERIGHRAAELLDSLMDGKSAPIDTILMPPVELLARQSSDAFAVDNLTVSKAMRFIVENAHRSLGVEQIAKHVSTTRRTLARLFAKHLGKSIYDTITHLRIERVKRQLSESGSALKTIASDCGFSDSIHLCKVFQRIEGLSPGEFRDLRVNQKRPAPTKVAGVSKRRTKSTSKTFFLPRS